MAGMEKYHSKHASCGVHRVLRLHVKRGVQSHI